MNLFAAYCGVSGMDSREPIGLFDEIDRARKMCQKHAGKMLSIGKKSLDWDSGICDLHSNFLRTHASIPINGSRMFYWVEAINCH